MENVPCEQDYEMTEMTRGAFETWTGIHPRELQPLAILGRQSLTQDNQPEPVSWGQRSPAYRPLLPPSGSWAMAELRQPDFALKKAASLQSSPLLPENILPQ